MIFEQVHQMISTITARVNEDISPIEIIKATFPMGSMTGAPKIAALKIIEELEETKRGLYSGAVGYFKPNGDFDFNVVIRSILYNEKRKYVSYSVGSAITSKSPFLKTEQFIVACSGGLDSIVLVSLAHKLKLNFALAHCNFQLRDQESDGDELFVRDFAKKLGIPLFVKQFNTKEELKKRKGSLQMVARDLRYEWFNELLKDTDYNYLLTGHHGDDSLETYRKNSLA